MISCLLRRLLSLFRSVVALPLGLFLAAGGSDLQARIFTGRTGVPVEAEVVAVSLATSTVRLRLPTGAEHDIPFANVSDADQAYLRQWTPPGQPAAAPGVAPQATPSATPSLGARPFPSNLPAKASTAPLGAPGETLTLEFPELPKDRKGAVAACKILLPTQYDPAKPMPLLLWFAGGEGSNDPREGLNLVDGATYAIAAMPYPITVNTPAKSLDNGQINTIRDFHMTMLKKLIATLPNVDAKRRFTGGFSNGAHVVGTYLSTGEREFVDYFHGYILIEGGGIQTKAKKTLRNSFAYLAWGDVAGNAEVYMRGIHAAVTEGRLKVTTRTMPGVAHGFPALEKSEVKKWIATVAEPGLAAIKP